jgi:hypothetical protein
MLSEYTSDLVGIDPVLGCLTALKDEKRLGSLKWRKVIMKQWVITSDGSMQIKMDDIIEAFGALLQPPFKSLKSARSNEVNVAIEMGTRQTLDERRRYAPIFHVSFSSWPCIY